MYASYTNNDFFLQFTSTCNIYSSISYIHVYPSLYSKWNFKKLTHRKSIEIDKKSKNRKNVRSQVWNFSAKTSIARRYTVNCTALKYAPTRRWLKPTSGGNKRLLFCRFNIDLSCDWYWRLRRQKNNSNTTRRLDFFCCQQFTLYCKTG